jgi:hypothetical protein
VKARRHPGLDSAGALSFDDPSYPLNPSREIRR